VISGVEQILGNIPEIFSFKIFKDTGWLYLERYHCDCMLPLFVRRSTARRHLFYPGSRRLLRNWGRSTEKNLRLIHGELPEVLRMVAPHHAALPGDDRNVAGHVLVPAPHPFNYVQSFRVKRHCFPASLSDGG
jgi:hypothetical protein